MLAKKPKGATQKRKTSSASGLLWMFVGAILTLMIGVFLYLSPLFDFSPAGESENDPDRQVEPRVNTDVDNGDYEFYDILPNQEMATIPDEAIGNSNSEQTGNIEAFEPDVVITQPENTTNNSDPGNFGVIENTTIEPTRGAQGNAGNTTDNDIVVVEENTTYDGTTPNSATNTGSTVTRPNNATATVQKPAAATTYILQINSFGNADEADRRRAQVLMAGVDAKVIKNTTGSGAPIYQVISRPMNNRQVVNNAQQRLQNNGIDSIIVEQRR